MNNSAENVEYDGKLYYRRIRGGYYILHPVVNGHIDYDTSIREHRLVYQLAHNIELDNDVVVHHINGNKLDNSVSNLMALSNSEHARLHTFGGDLTSDYTHEKVGICIDCGKEIDRKAIRCVDCAHIQTRTSMYPTREQLSEYIETMNNSQIGRMCGVSSKAVEKWRKTYGLPSYSEQHGLHLKSSRHV